MPTAPTAPRNPIRREAAATPEADDAQETTKTAGPSARPSSPFGRPGGDDDFIINLDGVNLSGGLVSEGDHYAYVSDVVKETSKAGNPMVTWTFTVYGQDDADAGKSLKVWTALTEDAMWKFVETCEAVGFAVPEDNRIRFGDLKAHALKTLVVLSVYEEKYNGRMTSKVANVYAPDEGAGTKIPSGPSPRR